MADDSPASVSDLEAFLSSPRCRDLYRLVEMIDAGNMHGYDFSHDPETVDLARRMGRAGIALGRLLASRGDLAGARLAVMNSLDLCWYIFPEEEDPAWTELLCRIEEKMRS